MDTFCYQIPDEAWDGYKKHFGRAASKEVKAHLKQDLFHATWALLINNDFEKAYKDGVEIMFIDGITRLVFPRFLTYLADYPERLACVTCFMF
jgi:hypothetical protein